MRAAEREWFVVVERNVVEKRSREMGETSARAACETRGSWVIQCLNCMVLDLTCMGTSSRGHGVRFDISMSTLIMALLALGHVGEFTDHVKLRPGLIRQRRVAWAVDYNGVDVCFGCGFGFYSNTVSN